VSASVTWTGLDELIVALRALPSELAGEGAHIVEGRANGAAATIKAGYPDRTGDLRNDLTVEHTKNPFGARSVVTNTSKHALPFELGSEVRRYITTHGVTHVTGRMPPNPLFSQTIQRERRAMYDVDFRELLTRKGLLVSGDA
jgi:hypothetical protein